MVKYQTCRPTLRRDVYGQSADAYIHSCVGARIRRLSKSQHVGSGFKAHQYTQAQQISQVHRQRGGGSKDLSSINFVRNAQGAARMCELKSEGIRSMEK